VSEGSHVGDPRLGTTSIDKLADDGSLWARGPSDNSILLVQQQQPQQQQLYPSARHTRTRPQSPVSSLSTRGRSQQVGHSLIDGRRSWRCCFD